jgi:hypothetical protein
MTWIDLFQFLNERANDLKNLGQFDWQAEVMVYDNNYGGIYTADLIELHNLKKPKIYMQIDSGDNNGS